jgi:hypothetical protein
MIRRFAQITLMLLAIGGGSLLLAADIYELQTGERIEGDPISFNPSGVVFNKPDGGFHPRVGWTNLTETTLKKLAAFPEGKRFAEEYLAEDIVPEEETAELEIKPQPVPRLERLPEGAGLFGMARSPLGLSLLLLIYLANIYAGFEIAIFRNYPVWSVCLAAALLPFVGPIIFLCLPTRIPGAAQPVYELPPDQQAMPTEEAAYHEAAVAEAPPPPAQSADKAAPAAVSYQRGTTTFNRRFFETKLANFMRVVPSEQDKDLMLLVKSARGDHAGSRITRVTPNEICLQISKGGASAEVMIPFSEIKEVQVCHKDALEKT